jgi:5-methylcytosine-specific restriction endonuclease McrA
MKMERRHNCQCDVCGTTMYRRPSQITGGGVYCSLICVGVKQQKPKICKICDQSYIGGKQTCSRACANQARAGITYTKTNEHNKAYRGSLLKEQLAKSRGGTCEKCSEKNYAILQVHHIKERYKGGTDKPSNLELLCPNCHTTHHQGYSLYKPKKML